MILKTERLILRKFDNDDIDIVTEINNDPECIRFNGWNSMSGQACLDVLNRWIDQYEHHANWGVFCVEEIESTEKVGMAFIYDHDNLKSYEIGFRFRRNKWSNGYAQEMTRAFISYAENNLKAKGIYAEVDAKNLRSLRIFEKFGFKKYEHPSGPEGILFRMDFET